jgi:hypothetical protein
VSCCRVSSSISMSTAAGPNRGAAPHRRRTELRGDRLLRLCVESAGTDSGHDRQEVAAATIVRDEPLTHVFRVVAFQKSSQESSCRWVGRGFAVAGRQHHGQGGDALRGMDGDAADVG